MDHIYTEAPIDFLRRAVRNLDYEDETLLQGLPTPEAVIDYFRLWSAYDTDLWSGVVECITSGGDRGPFDAFVAKHGLDWQLIMPQKRARKAKGTP